nr:reverse transcriptase domain-containing protein [Tanacetum cinerariifolium]
MSTRSSARNLFPALDNPELTIRRRSRANPTLLNDFEMAAEGNGDPPVPDLQTIKELCQPSLNGRVNQQVKAVTPNCEICGGPHFYTDCPATVGQTHNIYATKAYQGNSYHPQGNRNLLSYCSDNYIGPPGFNQNQNRKNQNENFYNHNRNQGNHHPQGNNQGRNQFFQGASHGQNPPPAYQALGYQAPVHQPSIPQPAPKPNLKASIPYPSRLHDQKLYDKANDQKEKFFQIFKDLDFNISFSDALILMPKFGPTIKTLLTNKDKLSELARTPLNEHCSMVLLKKLPEELGDPGKFLIQCDFSGLDECLALAHLSASIHLMPLSVWNKLSLSELSPMCMTLELVDRSISRPVGVAEDIYVKVGTFHFPADFVVVDFDADPRVPLILERSFLKNGRALIDVFEGKLTLRVGKEAITFNLDQTLRYSANYNDMTANRIDFIDMACEEYSDFLLEEVDAFLALEDDPTSPEVDHSYFDPEGDIRLLKAFLNDDPSLLPRNQGNYLPEV